MKALASALLLVFTSVGGAAPYGPLQSPELEFAPTGADGSFPPSERLYGESALRLTPPEYKAIFNSVASLTGNSSKDDISSLLGIEPSKSGRPGSLIPVNRQLVSSMWHEWQIPDPGASGPRVPIARLTVIARFVDGLLWQVEVHKPKTWIFYTRVSCIWACVPPRAASGA